MNKEINFMNFLYEFRRKIKVIIIAGLIGALIFSLYSYNNLKATNAGIKYASTCVLEVDNVGLVEDAGVPVIADLIEKNKAELLSDDVIEGAMNIDGASAIVSSSEELRKSLYVQGEAYGSVLRVITFTEDQEKSTELCKAIEESAKKHFLSINPDMKVLQHAAPFGPANIEERQKTTKPEQSDVILTSAAYPESLSASGVVKWCIKGFILFGIAAYCLVCALYILKGKIVYENELESSGIRVLGTKKKKEQTNKIAENIVAFADSDRIAIANCGSELDVSWLEKDLKQLGITTSVIGDITTKPYPIKKLESFDVVMMVKRDSVSCKRVINEIEKNTHNDINTIGAVFVLN